VIERRRREFDLPLAGPARRARGRVEPQRLVDGHDVLHHLVFLGDQAVREVLGRRHREREPARRVLPDHVGQVHDASVRHLDRTVQEIGVEPRDLEQDLQPQKVVVRVGHRRAVAQRLVFREERHQRIGRREARPRRVVEQFQLPVGRFRGDQALRVGRVVEQQVNPRVGPPAPRREERGLVHAVRVRVHIRSEPRHVVVEELRQQHRGQVDRDVRLRVRADDRRHVVIVLRRVLAHPRAGQLVARHVQIGRLVLMPDERDIDRALHLRGFRLRVHLVPGEVRDPDHIDRVGQRGVDLRLRVERQRREDPRGGRRGDRQDRVVAALDRETLRRDALRLDGLREPDRDPLAVRGEGRDDLRPGKVRTEVRCGRRIVGTRSGVLNGGLRGSEVFRAQDRIAGPDPRILPGCLARPIRTGAAVLGGGRIRCIPPRDPPVPRCARNERHQQERKLGGDPNRLREPEQRHRRSTGHDQTPCQTLFGLSTMHSRIARATEPPDGRIRKGRKEDEHAW